MGTILIFALGTTSTYIFGTKLLLTLGVEILGKRLDKTIFAPFKTIDEIIDLKNDMRKAPKGNVPILLTKSKTKIEVLGRLFKSGGLSHDPNIGALSIICAVLRLLGWTQKIEVSFLLNKNGQLILSVKAPKLFQEAIKNLLDFWK